MDLWGIFILQPMLNGLLFLYQLLFHNFTLAILVFTILIRLITYPLTASQQKSTRKLSELQQSDDWKKIQEKFKGNKEQLAQEQMKLYQQAGVSPFGACLPTLIQFPVLIGLYQAIQQAMAASPVQLFDLSRHLYPFLPNAASLIPMDNRFLWMNLGLPDPTLIMPILVAVSMYIQSKMITPPGSGDPQAAQMSQTMTLTMPLMFGFMSYSFPSGLSIYFIISNLIGIAQTAMTQPVDWKNVFSFSLAPAKPVNTAPAKSRKKQ
jgi:YidC/Oxa1 family membrane protein insertase